MDTSPATTHYLSPKLAARPVPHKGGMGVFAIEPVARGEILAMWGGRIVPVQEIYQFNEQQRHYVIQVEEGLFLTPSDPTEAAEYVNHSCDPSAGLNGQIALVALRDIASGEEICFDYAMSESHSLFEFECRCGSPRCRGWLRADDWLDPELQRRYAGYFSPYLQRRIDAQRRTEALARGRDAEGTRLPDRRRVTGLRVRAR
jgi:uncharacterized protein